MGALNGLLLPTVPLLISNSNFLFSCGYISLVVLTNYVDVFVPESSGISPYLFLCGNTDN